MLCNLHANLSKQFGLELESMREDDPPHSRIWFHRDRGCALQLLDRAGAMVGGMGKRSNGSALTGAGGQLLAPLALLDNSASQQVEMSDLLAGASFGTVFESSGEAILILDVNGAIHRCNPRASDLLRAGGSRAVGKNLAGFLAGQAAGDLAAYFQEARGAQAANLAERKNFDTFLSTGFPIRIVFRAVMPSSGDLLVCIEDGSIVQRAEGRWRQTTAELKSVLDSVEAGILLLDPLGRVRFSNDRFAQLFGMQSRTLSNLGGQRVLEELLA